MTALAVYRMVLPGEVAASDVLGMWQRVEPETAPAGAPVDVMIWRVALPAAAAEARRAMIYQTSLLRSSQAALPAVSGRLSVLSGEVSRSGLPAAADAALAEPERELLAWLAAAPGTGAQAFGPFEDLLEPVRRLAADVSGFYGNLTAALAQFALVETVTGGRLSATTRVVWQGDFVTFWRQGIGLDEARLHQQAVASVVATRRAWLRIALLVVAGATALAAGLAGAPFAPLAVYQFVRRIIDEYQQNLRSPSLPATS